MFYRKILKNACMYFRQYSSLSYFTVKQTLQKKPIGDKIIVKGWVQAVRKHKDLYFADLMDGTCLERLQIVIQSSLDKPPTYGSSIRVEGSLIKSSHKGQDVELLADNWSTYGYCEPGYPFENRVKQYSPEYIRQYPHLRPRTRKFSSVLRVRSTASFAVHQFFKNENFLEVIGAPVLTQNDCEGAGEVFSVTSNHKISDHPELDDDCESDSESDKPLELEKTLPKKSLDPEEFFGLRTYLTVSTQLHLEAMLSGHLSGVYTVAPVFRAEGSRTRQHASEFQMVEAEMCTDNLDDLIKLVEKIIKYIAKCIMEDCYPEVQFLSENVFLPENYLKNIITEPFVVMTYDEAVKILQAGKDKLKVPIQWGDDFAGEHKNFLVKYCNNIPVFVTMFPSSLKPFYMEKDMDKKVAYCFDLFALYGGEICGGSLRENDIDILMAHPVLQNPLMSWYMDIRKYGAVPHGGFGIGFDRLIQSLLRISNIRDVIPFPRRKNDCKC